MSAFCQEDKVLMQNNAFSDEASANRPCFFRDVAERTFECRSNVFLGGGMAHRVGFLHYYFVKTSKNLHFLFYVFGYQWSVSVDSRFAYIH